MFVEATKMSGTGELLLTGQLGMILHHSYYITHVRRWCVSITTETAF